MDERSGLAARVAGALLALILAVALLASLSAGGMDGCLPAVFLVLLAMVPLGPALARPEARADTARPCRPAARAPPALPSQRIL
jgi:hypothetical protein